MASLNRLLVVAGELSGARAIEPTLNKLLPTLHGRILYAGPETNSRYPLNPSVTVPSFSGLLLSPALFNRYLHAMQSIHRLVRREGVSHVLLIDNPDFNLFLARALHRLGVRLYYFIPPQVWAWRSHRSRLLKKYFKKVFVIFPFETEFFKRKNIEATFVGHPSYERSLRIPTSLTTRMRLGIESEEAKVISLFPGTRPSVLKRHAGFFEKIAQTLRNNLKDVKIIISDVTGTMKKRQRVDGCVYDDSDALEILNISTIGIASAGSLSMEALFTKTPVVGVYKPDIISELAGRFLINTKYILMPNILAGREIVREFISYKLSPSTVVEEALKLLQNQSGIESIKNSLNDLSSAFFGRITSEILSDELTRELRI
jgi:lipid-A-disaccharide synthase